MPISKLPKDTLIAKDASGKRTELITSGVEGDSLKVVSGQEYLLEEILKQLKLNNKILNEGFNLDFKEDDVIGE